MTLPEILTHFQGLDQDRDSHWMAWCPVHEAQGAHRPSLSISLNGTKVLLKCFANCRTEDIVRAAGMQMADLFLDERKAGSRKKVNHRLVAEYNYHDAAGKLAFQVVRFDPKDFRQRRPNPDKPGFWIWNMDGVERVLYRLPEVVRAVQARETVYLVEGEKDADLLARLGLCGTTSPMGAGKWKDEYAAPLDFADVVIIPDVDPPEKEHAGQRHALEVYQSVSQVANVRFLVLPAKDLSAWAETVPAGSAREQLLQLAEAAPAKPPDDWWELLRVAEDKPEPVPEHPPEPAPAGPETDRHLLTDLGNARRLVDRHGATMRYCRTHARWYAWDGRQWSGADGYDLVMQRAKETADNLLRVAADDPDASRKKAIGTHALHMQAASRLDAMIRLAETEPGVPIKPDEFDKDPMLLNVANGIMDLATGELLPHDPARMMTRLAPVSFDPAAACPRFHQYLERVIPDEEEREFLQRAAGYTLSGDTGARVLFFLWGKGHNGKSTFLDIFARILGDYAHRVPVEVIMERKGDAIPNDLAMLAGLRFAYTSETKAQKRLDEGRVKDITSGAEPMTARFLRAEYFEFRPVCKFFLATNHKPIIKGTDSGLWGRIRLVPFIETIPEEERIQGLANSLFDEEGPGILNWALQGCREWQRVGMGAPEVVKQAVSEYKQESDPLADYLDECCIVEPTVSDTSRALYLKYESWSKENGEKFPISRMAFGLALGERGFRKERSRSGIVWHGVKTASYSEISTFLSENDSQVFTVNTCVPLSGKGAKEKISHRVIGEMGSQVFTDLKCSQTPKIGPSNGNLFLKSYDAHLAECKKCKIDAQGADLCDEGKRIFDEYLKSIGEVPHE